MDKIRKLMLEFLLAHAPCSPQLLDLAQDYGADIDRFEKESSFYILYGLCVRYWAEVKKKHAAGFVNNGARRYDMRYRNLVLGMASDLSHFFPISAHGQSGMSVSHSKQHIQRQQDR